jgi:hypothetical protein
VLAQQLQNQITKSARMKKKTAGIRRHRIKTKQKSDQLTYNNDKKTAAATIKTTIHSFF